MYTYYINLCEAVKLGHTVYKKHMGIGSEVYLTSKSATYPHWEANLYENTSFRKLKVIKTSESGDEGDISRNYVVLLIRSWVIKE